ncbi:hypothetical protein GLOIN_2v1773465 [Rhizophagus irregularis DAOM 181602=DAOM 197198]|uniref:Uncharacterized protein n=1 Tax=Rhizophagus irregularis (strain DAOM 197198w) TaxID=1432141 RepID=A0A015L3L7_RHIIW|nr:hypothetical protein RirG_118240 [Rhizophagus irregularis DAOM 197198w]GBC20054.1 hypothetical protein GLOIN_2v1773465 [Rhizophagus irregularis DAOM 181602=DAOM 197198]
MSHMGDSVGTPAELFLEFIAENGFLKTLFDKNPQQPVDKAQLLVDMFGESANLNNFAQQAAVTNIQPTTLSLLFSIALYVSSRLWDDFASRAYTNYGDMGDSESECPSADDEFGSTFLSTLKTTPKPVHITPPILPDVEITPVNQTVTPETSRKKYKQKARVAKDKQVIHQSFTANPEAQTPDKQNTLFLGAKTTAPGSHIY